MTMDDAFDQRLKAAFADAQAPLEAPSEADIFTDKVVKRLSSPNRKRVLILGGAGSTGSAVAGTQLEGVFSSMPVPADGLLSNVAFLMSPEAMAAFALALAAGMVAVILPRRIV
ncbi:MAG: hypothetical protein GYB36_09870 [Alphaproteobacteria bacterium]|nr:hypothetical protein [Alphaproteobacteria bacterium]